MNDPCTVFFFFLFSAVDFTTEENPLRGKYLHHLSHVMRKHVFGVSDQARLKLACSATETC